MQSKTQQEGRCTECGTPVGTYMTRGRVPWKVCTYGRMWGMMIPYVTDAGEGYQSLQTQEKISSRYRRSGRRSFHPDEDQATQRQGFFHDALSLATAISGDGKVRG